MKYTILEHARFFPSWLAVMLCATCFVSGLWIGYAWDFKTDAQQSKEILLRIHESQVRTENLADDLHKMQVNINYFLSTGNIDKK